MNHADDCAIFEENEAMTAFGVTLQCSCGAEERNERDRITEMAANRPWKLREIRFRKDGEAVVCMACNRSVDDHIYLPGYGFKCYA